MTIPTINIAEKRVGFKRLKLDNIILYGNYRAVSIDRIKELGDSILKVGQIQPALINRVRKKGKIHYQLFAGNRRYLANKLIGSDYMPCIIFKELSDLEMRLMQVTENIKKRIDSAGKKEAVAEAIRFLTEQGKMPESVSQAAEMLGIPRSRIEDANHYVNLESSIKAAEKEGRISFSQALEIGRLADKKEQLRVFDRLLSGEIRIKSARELSAYITGIMAKKLEMADALFLTCQENERIDLAVQKSEEYNAYFQRITSYTRSISFMLKSNPELKQNIRNARLDQFALSQLTANAAKQSCEFERIIAKYNPEGLSQAINPKKKKSILKEIIEERKIIDRKGESRKITELMKKAEFRMIDIGCISPDPEQPRTTKRILSSDNKTDYCVLTEDYDEYTWALSDSITAIRGIESPIRVIKEKNKKSRKEEYKIVVGESRYWGAMKSGLKKLPCLVSEPIDNESCRAIQLEEDLHERDSSIERGQALANIKELLKDCFEEDHGKDREKAKKKAEKEFADFIRPYLGLRPDEVNDYMRLLRLEKGIQNLFYNGITSLTGVLELSRACTRQRHYLCDIILADSLTTRDIKKLVDNAIEASVTYSHVADKEKEFLSECESAGKDIARSKIISETIQCMAGLQSLLEKAPAESNFYKNYKMIKSYVSFRKALQEFNQEIKPHS